LQRELHFEADTPFMDDSVDLLNVSLPATSSMHPPAATQHADAPQAPAQRRTLGALSANTAHTAVPRGKGRGTGASGGAGLLADDSFTAMLQSM